MRAATVDFYASHSVYSRPGHLPPALEQLPADARAICRAVQSLLIHPHAASEQGYRFNWNRRLRAMLDFHSVDQILADAALRTRLSDAQAPRAVFTCEHQLLLCLSLMREKGLVARARCGYASWLVPGRWTPHWTGEVWHPDSQCFVLYDVESDSFPQPGQFLTGGAAWLAVHTRQVNVQDFLPDWRDGLDGIKYRLLCDINGLIRQELLMYDWLLRDLPQQAPELLRISSARLADTQQQLLLRLAAFSAARDADPFAERELLLQVWTAGCRRNDGGWPEAAGQPVQAHSRQNDCA